MEVETKEKLQGKRDRSTESSDDDKPEWEEVTIEEFEKKHGKYEETIVDFEVKVIEEFDYKSINAYLENYLNNKTFDSRALTDIILKQEYLGSAIRQADDDECFGFISALNINVHKSELCIVQIQNYITSNAPANEKTYWNDLVHGERLGLLLSERVINIPHGLAPGLHYTIYEEVLSYGLARKMEINWAIEDGNPFEFNNIIYITSYAHDDPEGLVVKKKKKVKKDKEIEKKNWFKIEDTIYLKYASRHFTKPVNHSETKVIMQIPMNIIPTILKEINQFIEENYNW